MQLILGLTVCFLEYLMNPFNAWVAFIAGVSAGGHMGDDSVGG